MPISKEQAMRPAEIELIDAVNGQSADITGLQQASAESTAAIAAESKARESADAELAKDLASQKTEIAKDLANQKTEIAQDLASQKTELEGSISAEAKARQDADTGLEQKITAASTAAETARALAEGKQDKLTAGANIAISDANEISSSVPNPAVNETDSDGNMTAWTECGQRQSSSTTGSHSHAEGDNNIASGSESHAEGSYTAASGNRSHAEGHSTNATATTSHAEGDNTIASGFNSHAEGNNTTASGNDSHAEGEHTIASGNGSHAEGEHTTASDNDSHAEGAYTAARGSNSHAEGRHNTARGFNSHAEGMYCECIGDNQHVQGKFNKPDSSSIYADIIGNGTADDNRSNAETVSWDGVMWLQKDVRCGGADQDASDAVSLSKLGTIVASTPSMEYGTSNSVSVSAGSHTVVDVTFGTAKTEAPVVFTSLQCPTAGANIIATVQSVTNAQASIVVVNLGTTDVSDVTVDWLALSGR